ncbi:MAG TPA: hypothetical protein VND64_35245 [Pirellulales bacterium]|nr:hypothetical protein [Pirellulales bacterium]
MLQRKCLCGGNFTSVPELETQLRQFITYYNSTMAHPFNWTYTGKPLQKNRRAQFVLFCVSRKASFPELRLA